jgi:hypothetical protein
VFEPCNVVPVLDDVGNFFIKSKIRKEVLLYYSIN